MEDRERCDDDIMAPRPTWPNATYAAKALGIYAAWAIVAGILAFVGIVVYAVPLNVAVFAAGIAFAVVSRRLWKAGVREFVMRYVPWNGEAASGH